MAKPDSDPSIHNEPQFRETPARPDPSETSAIPAGGGPTAKSGPKPEDLAEHSVFDEPDTLPGRTAETIDRNWSCGRCGYNLRGLQTGQRCPECGHKELYRPPPRGEASFGSLYRERKAATTAARSWTWIAVAAAFGGPWAVLGALINNLPTPLTTIVFGPTVEEVMKLAAIAYLVEARPHLIRSAAQVRAAALAGALGFAVIENLMYLEVFIPSPTLALMLWRWIVCTAMHLGCTAIAVSGLIGVWQRTDREARRPRIGAAFRPLLLAIFLHGGYNAFVTFLGVLGVGF